MQRAEREQLRVQQQQERQQRQEEQKARERRTNNRVDLMMEMVFGFRKWIKEEKLTCRKQLKKERAKRVQQLERVQEQLELNLEREAAFRKKGWTVSQNLVANIEDAGSSAEAAEIDRFISRSSRLARASKETGGRCEA